MSWGWALALIACGTCALWAFATLGIAIGVVAARADRRLPTPPAPRPQQQDAGHDGPTQAA